MNLLHLKYACEVERCGSINQAAKNLYISQPYLSNCLQALEQSVNVSLFTRSNRGVAPTDRGRDFLSMAKTLLAQAEMMEQRYARQAARGPDLQIASIRTAVAMHAYLEYYRTYIGHRPSFEAGYYEAGFDTVIESVYRRSFSLGLIMYYTGQKAFIENYAYLRDLRFVEVGTAPLHVILSQSNPLSNKKKIGSTDIQDLTYVTYSDFKHSILDLHNECKLIDMAMPGKLLYVHDRHALMNALSTTECFALAHHFTQEDETRYQLISIPAADKKYRVHFGYVYPKGISFGPESNEQKFIQIYRQVVGTFA